MENLAAEIPADLRGIDELLDRYGMWAVNHRRAHRCASAEGRYRSGDGALRQVEHPPLTAAQVLDAQRALASVPDQIGRAHV